MPAKDQVSLSGKAAAQKSAQPRLWLLCAVLAPMIVLVACVEVLVRPESVVGRMAANAPQATATPAARLFLPIVPFNSGVPIPGPTRPPSDIRRTEFGLAFVNSAEEQGRISESRIRRGADAGARWDRFPFYWTNIERTQGVFDWSAQESAVRDDEGQGLEVMAILLGTPGQYNPGARAAQVPMPPVGGSFVRNMVPGRGAANCGPPAPSGLYNPIFTDGSDYPGPGKVISDGNPWARFVARTVQRFKPGGSAGFHVSVWEVWNEPDLCQFWAGTAQEYARLLKVAYLVIHQYDPAATVLWGGLAHYEQPQFLYTLMDTLRNDSMSAQFAGLFDGAASHQYAITWNSYVWTKKIRDALTEAGWQDKAIWVTESGVPVCNDFPGPSCPSPWRATPEEQAAYIWQNLAYSRLVGGGPIIQFDLHDDCGNVVAPDSPDGFGIVKNEPTSYCSPDDSQKRLSYTAHQLAARYFRGTDLLWGDIQDNAVRRVAFYEPQSKERRLLTWALTAADSVAHIAATGTHARRIALDGSELALTPVGGEYQFGLQGATNRNSPNGSGGYDIGIYGKPYLLIEQDTMPPLASIVGLQPQSPPTFPVGWHSSDLGSGVAFVDVWFQAGNGPWQVWKGKQEPAGSALFAGGSNQRYRFAALATDWAGNSPTNLVAQAETTTADHVDQATVSGQVVDIRNQPAAGVTVQVGGVGSTTDNSGNFWLQVPFGQWDVKINGRVALPGRSFAADAVLSLLLWPVPNAVTNGDFSAGSGGWQAGGSCPWVVEAQPDSQAHVLHLGSSFVADPGVPNGHGGFGGNSTISQRVSVPSGHPFLAVHYKVESQETQPNQDWFEVILVRGNGEAYYPPLQTSPGAWTLFSLDLASYAGADVTLILNLYQSSGERPTVTWVDQVAIGQPPNP